MSTTATTAPAKAALPNEGRPGYKHTKLGWIPEEWEVCLLGDAFEFRNGYNANIADYGHGVPFVNVLDVITHTALTEDLIKGKVNIGTQAHELNSVQHGDVLFNRTSETPEEVGLAAIYTGDTVVTFGGFVIRGRQTGDAFDTEYLRYGLRVPVIRKQIIAMGNGAVRSNIGQSDLSKVLAPKPPLPEQRRIAAVLGAWDRAIATVQQLLAAQQERKRGLMQELLTGRRRFKGFGGKWKECELGELGQFRTSSVDKKFVEGQQRVRLVNYMDVYNNQRIHSGMPFMEVTAKDSQFHSSTLRRGDILFTPSSETPDDIGHSAVVVEDMVNTLFSYHVMRFRPHDDTLELDFRAYVFNNESILKQFSAKATGSTRYTLSASDFGDTLVRFPTDKSEQQAIARTLMACDSEIESMTNQLDQLTTQKRGLMQQLLTGAVRVKP